MKQIAFIDDEAILRQSAEMALSPRGYSVTVYPTGGALLAASEESLASVDCLVIDYDLSDVDGPSLYSQIATKVGNTPVIFISGYPIDNVGVADDTARVAFLKKPFHFDALASTIEQLTTPLGDTEASTE